MTTRAKQNRKYEELNVGDKVKVTTHYLKGEDTTKKIEKSLGRQYY